MTQINKWECFTYTAAAQALGVAVWRVRYAVESGYLPQPGMAFRRRALFSPGQLEWMRAYFDRDTASRPTSTGASIGATPCPPASPIIASGCE